jgi:outer membrane murein-binding lipoprotein Lpp
MLIDKTPIAWTVRRVDPAPYGDSSIRSIAAQGPVAGKVQRPLRAAFFTARMQRWLLGAFVVAATLLAGCAGPPDEAALRDRIDRLQVAVEARDAEALLDAVDEDFGGPGGMDRAGLARYASLMLLRQQRVGVTIGPIAIELYGDRATAQFDAVVTGTNRFVPEGVEARRVETVWRREGQDWVLVSADWSRPALAR